MIPVQPPRGVVDFFCDALKSLPLNDEKLHQLSEYVTGDAIWVESKPISVLEKLKSLSRSNFSCTDFEMSESDSSGFTFKCVLHDGSRTKTYPLSKRVVLDEKGKIVKVDRSEGAKSFLAQQQQKQVESKRVVVHDAPAVVKVKRGSFVRALVDDVRESWSHKYQSSPLCFSIGVFMACVMLSPWLLSLAVVTASLFFLVPFAIPVALLPRCCCGANVLPVLFAIFFCLAGLADMVADATFAIFMLASGVWPRDEGPYLVVRCGIFVLGPAALFIFAALAVKFVGGSREGKKEEEMPHIGGIALVLLGLISRLVLVGMRVVYMVWLIASINRRNRRRQMFLELMQLAFVAEFVWSSLPLGVLSLMEWLSMPLLYPSGFAIWKLVAISIDAIAAAQFIYLTFLFDNRLAEVKKDNDEMKRLIQ